MYKKVSFLYILVVKQNADRVNLTQSRGILNKTEEVPGNVRMKIAC